MKILTVLQNAYTHKKLARPITYPVWFYLFCRCRSGQRFAKVFDSLENVRELFKNRQLHFCNTTAKWGVGSDSFLKADLRYLEGRLSDVNPELVISCGKAAEEALQGIWRGNLVSIPHPASRTVTNNLLTAAGKHIETLKVTDSTEPIRVAFRQNKGYHSVESI